VTYVKPTCLACGERPVHCVGTAPLCAACEPHGPEGWGGLTFEEHARGCAPCAVFLVWFDLRDFPNTAADPRAARVRRVFATGSPVYDGEVDVSLL
jgi:hypothetical protein